MMKMTIGMNMMKNQHMSDTQVLTYKTRWDGVMMILILFLTATQVPIGI